MEKDNKYYEIIKNIVKNHRKYYGYEAILEDIIDDIYKHAKSVINTIKNEEVVISYLQKLAAVSIITVPKRLNFHKELKHRVISTDIQNSLPVNSYTETQKTEPAPSVVQEPAPVVQKANVEFVDKMINSIDTASITNNTADNLLSDSGDEQDVFADLSEDSVEVIEPAEENFESNDTETIETISQDADNNVENIELIEESEEELSFGNFESEQEAINSADTDEFEPVLIETVDDNQTEEIESNDEIETDSFEIIEPETDVEDGTDTEEFVSVLSESVEDNPIEEIESNDEIETDSFEILESETDVEDGADTEEFDSDLADANSDESEEEIETISDMAEVEDSDLTISLLDDAEEDSAIQIAETHEELSGDDEIEELGYQDEVINEDDAVNIETASESDIENIGPVESIELDDTDEVISDENLEDDNAVFELETENMSEDGSDDTDEIEVLNTVSEENNLDVQLNAEDESIELESFDSDSISFVNDSVDMQELDHIQETETFDFIDDTEDTFALTEDSGLEFIDDNNISDESSEKSEPAPEHLFKPVDYSMFNFVPDIHDENIDIQGLETKLMQLNSQKPELNIIDIFDLKYKQNLPITEIAEKLQMNKQDVITAIDEIVELI